MHFPKPVECTTLTVSHIINYGFGRITIYQYRLISWNKCTTLVGNVDNAVGGGGRSACVEIEGIWEISVPSLQCFCEPKSALKKKS